MIWNMLELLMLTEISSGFTPEEIGICELSLSWL